MNQVFAVGQSISGFGQPLDVAAHRRQVHAQSRQQLSYTVVQFARDAASFIILQLQQPSRQVAQILIGCVQVCRSLLHATLEFPLGLEQLLILSATAFRQGQDDERAA